jgi:endonuclease YncB( thermonuclease family)
VYRAIKTVGARRSKRWGVLLLLVGVGAALFATLPRGTQPGPSRADLVGPAIVLDGDTIIVERERIRLDGMDAPELAQRCEINGVAWACGIDARDALALFLQEHRVACVARGRDRYGRMLAHCYAGEQDVGGWMVGEGLAVAYTRYSWRYVPEELRARWHRRGLWASQFELPEEWRQRNQR